VTEQQTGLRLDLFFARALKLAPYFVIASAAVFATASFGNGLILGEGSPNISIRPNVFARDLLYTWTSRSYLGAHMGFTQVYATPFTWVHVALMGVGIPAEMTQRIVMWALYACIGYGMYWALSRIDASLSSAARCSGAVAYILNPYVAFNSAGSVPWLLTYATLPLMVGAVATGMAGRRGSGWSGAVTALVIFAGSGINPPLIVINVIIVLLYILLAVAASAGRTTAMRRATSLCAVAALATLLLNLYWIIPFADYIHSSWLGGLLDESPAMHNADSSFVNVLRGLGQWAIFRGDDSGFWYPWSPSYRSGFFAFSLWMVPIVGFTTPLFRRRYGLATAFFFSLAALSIPLVVGYYSGAVGPAITLPIYDFLYNRIPGFQMFRSVYKWVGPYELALCGLFAQSLQALMTHASGWRPQGKRKTLVAAPAFLGILIPIVAFWPVFWFKANHTLLPLPSWFHTEAAFVGSDNAHRVALMPGQYLERFVWGNVGFYIENAAIDRPMTYGQLAAAPYEPVDQFMRRAYRNARQGYPAAGDWFRTISVNDFLQRDDFVSDQDFSIGEAGPTTSTLAHDMLTGVIGARLSRSDGANKLYHLGRALPLVYGVVHPRLFPAPTLAVADSFPIHRMARGEAAITCDGCSQNDVASLLEAGTIASRDSAFVDDLATNLLARADNIAEVEHSSSVFKVAESGTYFIYAMRVGLTHTPLQPSLALDSHTYRPVLTDTHIWKRVGLAVLSAGAHHLRVENVGPFDPMLVALIPAEQWGKERLALADLVRRSNGDVLATVRAPIANISLSRGTYRVEATRFLQPAYSANDLPVAAPSSQRPGSKLLKGMAAGAAFTELPYVPYSGAVSSSPMLLPDEWYENARTYAWNRTTPASWIAVGQRSVFLVNFPGKTDVRSVFHLRVGAFGVIRIHIAVQGRSQAVVDVSRNDIGTAWTEASTLARRFTTISSKEVALVLHPGPNRVEFNIEGRRAFPAREIPDLPSSNALSIVAAFAPDTAFTVPSAHLDPRELVASQQVKVTNFAKIRLRPSRQFSYAALQIPTSTESARGDPHLQGVFNAPSEWRGFIGILLSPEDRNGSTSYRQFPLSDGEAFSVPLTGSLPDSSSDGARRLLGVWAFFVPPVGLLHAARSVNFSLNDLHIRRAYTPHAGPAGKRQLLAVSIDGRPIRSVANVSEGAHTFRVLDRSEAIGLLNLTSVKEPQYHLLHFPITFRSPTSVDVPISPNSAPFVLVLNESYHPRWRATLDGQPLQHVHVNGFANGWIVPHVYHRSEIKIRFSLQPLFVAASAISILTALALVAFLIRAQVTSNVARSV